MPRRITRKTVPKILIGSMCTGYGGLDAGVAAVLGGELAWAADNDPGASAIIAHRMPDIPNLGDIRHVIWENIQPVDIVCAGFPCQPVSGAGKQKGTADERWLWPGIADAISRMGTRPGLLVLENVPRLLTIEGGAAISQVIRSLSSLGYVGCYGIYSAAAAGAPHLRKRWFLLAADAHGEPRGQWRITAPGETQGRRPWADTCRSDRASVPDPGSQGLQRMCTTWGHQDRQRPSQDGRATRPRDVDSPVDWQEYGLTVRRWELITGYPVPHPVEPGKNGNNRMAAVFPEWLMGLPPGWVTHVPGLSRSAQLRAIGNGVVPQQAALAVSSLTEILRGIAQT